MTYDKNTHTLECHESELGTVEKMFQWSLDTKVDWNITITKMSGKKLRLIRLADRAEWY